MYLIGICEEDYEFRKWAKKLIEGMFQKKAKDYSVFEFASAKEVRDFYAKKACELDFFFLDTTMEGESVLPLAKKIKQMDVGCQIVFWSQSLSESSMVYEIEHSYHVEKKLLEEKLEHIYKCLLRKNREFSSKKLVLELKGKKQILNQSDIQYIERFKRTTNIYLTNRDDVIAVSKKLDELLPEINPNCFVRCHNSYIVNLDYVSSYYRTKFVLADGTSIPISRRFYEEVKQGFYNWELH